MSKNRKILFYSRTEGASVTGSSNEPDHRKDDVQMIESSSAIKRELMLVLVIVIGITLSFGAIYVTDKQSNWVEGTSERIAKLFIRSY